MKMLMASCFQIVVGRVSCTLYLLRKDAVKQDWRKPLKVVEIGYYPIQARKDTWEKSSVHWL